MKSEIIKNDKNDDTRIIYIDRLDLKKIEKNIEKSLEILRVANENGSVLASSYLSLIENKNIIEEK